MKQALTVELAACCTEEALACSARWDAAQLAGDRALERSDLLAARASFEQALGVAEALLDGFAVVGLPLYRLSLLRLRSVLRVLGLEREAKELSWAWLDRVLRVAESSQAPVRARFACLGQVDMPLKQVLTDLGRESAGAAAQGECRVRAALDRIRRASDAIVRARHGAMALS